MEACGIKFFTFTFIFFPLTLMLATASAQVWVPLGHSSLYLLLLCRLQKQCAVIGWSRVTWPAKQTGVSDVDPKFSKFRENIFTKRYIIVRYEYLWFLHVTNYANCEYLPDVPDVVGLASRTCTAHHQATCLEPNYNTQISPSCMICIYAQNRPVRNYCSFAPETSAIMHVLCTRV